MRLFFFFNDTATTEIYTLSLHDALPIYQAFLRVKEPGADLQDVVGVRLRELCLHRVDCIYVDLPLSHPAVQSAGARLDELGFFFGGIIPELRDGDVLRLQYLNEVDVRPDDVRTEIGRASCRERV